MVQQDLTADFDDDDAGTSGDSAEVDFEIESDVRNGYAVNISSADLDRNELSDLLRQSRASTPRNANFQIIDDPADSGDLVNINDDNGADAEDEFFDDIKRVDIIDAEGEYTFDFTDIDEGNHMIETNVTDADAPDSDSIEVVDTSDDESAFEDGAVSE